MNETKILKKRSLLGMFFLTLITCGIYLLYWVYATKHEINNLGGKIPSFIFALLPLVHFYFYYCYARDFVNYVRRDTDQTSIWLYFFLFVFFPVIAPFVIQHELNNYKPHI
jgi:hypothetical protein